MIDKALIKSTAKKLDDLVVCSKFINNKILATIAEMGDGYLFSYGLEYLNEKFGDKIPQVYVDNVETILTNFVADNYQEIIDNISDSTIEVLDSLVNLEAIADDLEAQWIAINVKTAVEFIKFYALKKLNK